MTVADLILAAVLVLLLPAYMLGKSLKQRSVPAGDRVRRYQRTISLVVVPLLAVIALWIARDRSMEALGLGLPGRVGAVLIVVAALLIAVLAVVPPRRKLPADSARHAAAAAMMPAGRRETGWFLLFAVAAGFGWEVLYRGYLWWALAPAVGSIGAVGVMAMSYGLAHGYRSNAALIGSLVSALLFAGGYALTGSLWWLVVIHIGLPLVGLRVRPAVA